MRRLQDTEIAYNRRDGERIKGTEGRIYIEITKKKVFVREKENAKKVKYAMQKETLYRV